MDNSYENLTKKIDILESKLRDIELLLKTPGGSIIHHINKFRSDVSTQVKLSDRNIYNQIEALLYLNKELSLASRLPLLRGWCVSPDALLYIYEYIRRNKPKVIVEFGSGSSTVVISKALKDNGYGILYSYEHRIESFNETSEMLNRNFLSPWVELKHSPLSQYDSEEFPEKSERNNSWYTQKDLEALASIDMVLVDGPPESTCKHARLPALYELYERLSSRAVIFLDDSKRDSEKEIIDIWRESFEFDLLEINFDKGLSLIRNLKRVTAKT